MSARLRSRLWRHHLPLGLVSAACVWLLYVTRDYSDVLTRLSFATAYPALALLATSNDVALRKLGLPDWKRLQRWNYLCFGLTALHTFGYLLGIKALKPSLIATAALCVTAAVTLQYLGWRRRRAI